MAYQERLFSVTLVIIHCKDLTVIVLKMYKEAAVLSALMKVYTILCHNIGNITIVLDLQSSTDSQHILQGSHATSPHGLCYFCNMEVEEDIRVKEESFVAADEGAIRIKQEETAEDITFPDIKAEPDEVSYVCY